MKQKEYEDACRELVFRFIAKPAIILLGMYLIGAFIDTFAKTQNTFSIIFAAVGGIGYIASYFVKEVKKEK